MNLGETTNWLSDIIKECRQIERWIPYFERQAEKDCIVKKIKAHADGKAFAAHKRLTDAVWGSLAVANERERYISNNPGINIRSPETTAAQFISDELGIPLFPKKRRR